MVSDWKETLACFKHSPIFASEIFGVEDQTSHVPGGPESKFINFAENSLIIRRGDTPKVFRLVVGSAKIEGFDAISCRHRSRLITKDEIIGVNAVLSCHPFRFSVCTHTPSVFEIIDSLDFTEYLAARPSVCFRVLKRLSLDIDATYNSFFHTMF